MTNKKKNNGWKRIAAGAMSIALVAGSMPANVGGLWKGSKGIEADAASYKAGNEIGIWTLAKGDTLTSDVVVMIDGQYALYVDNNPISTTSWTTNGNYVVSEVVPETSTDPTKVYLTSFEWETIDEEGFEDAVPYSTNQTIYYFGSQNNQQSDAGNVMVPGEMYVLSETRNIYVGTQDIGTQDNSNYFNLKLSADMVVNKNNENINYSSDTVLEGVRYINAYLGGDSSNNNAVQYLYIRNANEYFYLQPATPTENGSFTVTVNAEDKTVTIGYISDATSYMPSLPDGWAKDIEQNRTSNEWYVTKKDIFYSYGVGAPHTGEQYLYHDYHNNANNIYTPRYDLSDRNVGKVSFYYQNMSDYNYVDNISFSYRVGDGDWNELFRTEGVHNDWTLAEIDLPAEALAENVQFRFNANTNYGYGVRIDDFLLQANATTQYAAVTTAPQANTLTYTGEEFELITEGAAENGTMQYKLGANGTYSQNLPKATAAGDYTVYYKAVGNNGYEDSEENSVPVTIAQADPSASDFTFTPPENLSYDENGKAAEITVADGITGMGDVTQVLYKKDGDFLPDSELPTDAGTYQVYAVLAEGDNYNASDSLTDDSWTFDIDYAETELAIINLGNNVKVVKSSGSEVEIGENEKYTILGANSYYIYTDVTIAEEQVEAYSLITERNKTYNSHKYKYRYTLFVPTLPTQGYLFSHTNDFTGKVFATDPTKLYVADGTVTQTDANHAATLKGNSTYYFGDSPSAVDVEINGSFAKYVKVAKDENGKDKVYLAKANGERIDLSDGTVPYGTYKLTAELIVDNDGDGVFATGGDEQTIYTVYKDVEYAARPMELNNYYLSTDDGEIPLSVKFAKAPVQDEELDTDDVKDVKDEIYNVPVTIVPEYYFVEKYPQEEQAPQIKLELAESDNEEFWTKKYTFTYTSLAQKPAIIAKNGGNEALVLSDTAADATETAAAVIKDYDNAVEEQIDAGNYTYELTAVSDGRYSDSVVVAWSIGQADIGEYITITPNYNVDTDTVEGNDAIVYDAKKLDDTDFIFTAAEDEEGDTDEVKAKKALARQLVSEMNGTPAVEADPDNNIEAQPAIDAKTAIDVAGAQYNSPIEIIYNNKTNTNGQEINDENTQDFNNYIVNGELYFVPTITENYVRVNINGNYINTSESAITLSLDGNSIKDNSNNVLSKEDNEYFQISSIEHSMQPYGAMSDIDIYTVTITKVPATEDNYLTYDIKNAGEQTAKVTLTNSNFIDVEKNIDLTIAKRQVTVVPNGDQFMTYADPEMPEIQYTFTSAVDEDEDGKWDDNTGFITGDDPLEALPYEEDQVDSTYSQSPNETNKKPYIYVGNKISDDETTDPIAFDYEYLSSDAGKYEYAFNDTDYYLSNSNYEVVFAPDSYFTVNPKELTPDMFRLITSEYTFDGTMKTPEYEFSDGGFAQGYRPGTVLTSDMATPLANYLMAYVQDYTGEVTFDWETCNEYTDTLKNKYITDNISLNAALNGAALIRNAWRKYDNLDSTNSISIKYYVNNVAVYGGIPQPQNGEYFKFVNIDKTEEEDLDRTYRNINVYFETGSLDDCEDYGTFAQNNEFGNGKKKLTTDDFYTGGYISATLPLIFNDDIQLLMLEFYGQGNYTSNTAAAWKIDPETAYDLNVNDLSKVYDGEAVDAKSKVYFTNEEGEIAENVPRNNISVEYYDAEELEIEDTTDPDAKREAMMDYAAEHDQLESAPVDPGDYIAAVSASAKGYDFGPTEYQKFSIYRALQDSDIRTKGISILDSEAVDPAEYIEVVVNIKGEEVTLTENRDYVIVSAAKPAHSDSYRVEIMGIGKYVGFAEGYVDVVSDVSDYITITPRESDANINPANGKVYVKCGFDVTEIADDFDIVEYGIIYSSESKDVPVEQLTLENVGTNGIEMRNSSVSNFIDNGKGVSAVGYVTISDKCGKKTTVYTDNIGGSSVVVTEYEAKQRVNNGKNYVNLGFWAEINKEGYQVDEYGLLICNDGTITDAAQLTLENAENNANIEKRVNRSVTNIEDTGSGVIAVGYAKISSSNGRNAVIYTNNVGGKYGELPEYSQS